MQKFAIARFKLIDAQSSRPCAGAWSESGKSARKDCTAWLPYLNRPPQQELLSLPRSNGRFADVMRRSKARHDPAFRKAYLRLFVDKIVVNDNEISITGPKATLAKAATFNDLPPAAATMSSLFGNGEP